MTVFLNFGYPTTRFLYKKISRPTTEGFYHLQAFLKATFIPVSTKRQTNVIFCYFRDPFEIFHDPLQGRDPSFEKRWDR